MSLLSTTNKRHLVESTIDSIAKGIVHVTKITAESELFVSYCQFYLKKLDVCPADRKTLESLDESIEAVFKLIIDGRIHNWLEGKTEKIEFHNGMFYYLNPQVVLEHARNS